MSGELSQEDNPFFEEQWKFVAAVVKLLSEQKEASIGSPLLQGVQHALEKHQIPETKAQANIDGAIEDIAALLFDGVYSCDFIHDPVLLSSGYSIDKAVFDILSAEGLLSDTILPLHPANPITQQLIQLFNHFLGVVKESLKPDQVPASLSAWLAEHFSDEINQTHLAAAKQLEQEQTVEEQKKSKGWFRLRASSVVLGEEAVLISRIGKIEVEKKRSVEKGTLDLVESLTQEVRVLTEDLKKSSAKKQTETVSQESLTGETISAYQPDRLYRVMGWMMLFFLSAAVVILALSTFLPNFYQAFMLFLSSHTGVAALLLAALVVFGVCVFFTVVHFILTAMETSPAPSVMAPKQLTLQNPEARVLGPFSRSVLDLLDARQRNTKKYTRLIAVIRSRSSALEESQLRDEFLQQSIVGLKQQHFEEHEVARHVEKEQIIAQKQVHKARVKNLMIAEAEREMEKSLETAHKNRWPQPKGNVYGDLRFQLFEKDRSEENKAIYAAFWSRYWDDEGYVSDGSIAESDAQGVAKAAAEGRISGQYKEQWTVAFLSDEESEESEEEPEEEEQSEQVLQLH